MGKRFLRVTLLVCGFASGISAQVSPPTFNATRILDVRRLLDVCPQNDPAINIIRADIEIRRNGQPTSMPACTEPASAMPAAQITEELALLQALRVAYYMDRGRSNYLPWTNLRFYDWVKSKIAGINIGSSPGIAGSCCTTINNKSFMSTGLQDAFSRSFANMPRGALNLMTGLISHEARHADGFPHPSGCCTGIQCDQAYDERNLSPYGIAFYLQREIFLRRSIDVGLECDYAGAVSDSVSGFQSLLERSNTFFCDAKPNYTFPANPIDFARCQTRTLTLNADAVANAANYENTVITPGSLMTVFSPSIDATSLTTFRLGANNKVPSTIDNTRMIFNGFPGPMLYVAPGQLSAAAPFDFGTVAVENGRLIVLAELERNGRLSMPTKLQLALGSPGLFTVDGSGNGPLAALNQDGSVNSEANPAAPGSIVVLFGTGFGPLAGPATNALVGTPVGSPLPEYYFSVLAQVNNQNAEVLYGGQAPQLLAGVSQMNVRIPANVSIRGSVNVRVSLRSPVGGTVMQLRGVPTVWVR